MKHILKTLAEARISLTDAALTELPVGTKVEDNNGELWVRGRGWWTQQETGAQIRIGHLTKLRGPKVYIFTNADSE